MWTADKVLELAPDEQSAKAGKTLANTHSWSGLGADARAVWGLCKGSGKDPYQCRIDLNGPAFKCTCPSHKFPCKHSLGLFLLYARDERSFKETAAPGWVTDWLRSREAKSRKEEKQESGEAPRLPDPESQAKRIEQREKRILAGLNEVSLWLSDMVRQGLGWAHTQPPSFWDGMAARMVDAQAPGLATRIRKMAQISMSGQRWQERLLDEVGRMYLLIEAYRKLDQLEPDLQADVRSLMGWAVQKEQLAEVAGVRDKWDVLAQHAEQQERLAVQRTWLWGRTSRRFAMLLDFAAGNAVLDRSMAVGTAIIAELVFYPGIESSRAIVKAREDTLVTSEPPSQVCSVNELGDLYAQRLAVMPWTDAMPVFVGPVAIVGQRTGNGDETKWVAVDGQHNTIALPFHFQQAWHLLSVTGGQTATIFGLWDGCELLPLSFFCNGRFFTVIQSPVSGVRCMG